MSDVPKISYFTKTPLTCPVCGESVLKEELLSGSGRLIAGDLTDELHRTYEKTKKYGLVYPLAYTLPSCPSCHFSAFTGDWATFKPKNNMQALITVQNKTYDLATRILGPLDYRNPRRLQEGVASYLLAVFVYEDASKECVPVMKQAMAALRGAWLASYLPIEDPSRSEEATQLSAMLYRKAAFYYRYACELEETTSTGFSKLSFLGPDQDNNFGFDGVIYLSSLLEFKYGQRQNAPNRLLALNDAKIIISKIVGSGKSSKSKPKDILDLSRALYNSIKEEISLLEAELSPE